MNRFNTRPIIKFTEFNKFQTYIELFRNEIPIGFLSKKESGARTIDVNMSSCSLTEANIHVTKKWVDRTMAKTKTPPIKTE